jgi:hypothetical protein
MNLGDINNQQTVTKKEAKKDFVFPLQFDHFRRLLAPQSPALSGRWGGNVVSNTSF